MRNWYTVAIILLCGVSCTAGEPVPDWRNKTIKEYREQLFQNGWKLFPPERKEEADPVASDLIDAGISEVLYCTMTGVVRCEFLYRKSQYCLQVTTRGESDIQEKKFPSVATVLVADCQKALDFEINTDAFSE